MSKKLGWTFEWRTLVWKVKRRLLKYLFKYQSCVYIYFSDMHTNVLWPFASFVFDYLLITMVLSLKLFGLILFHYYFDPLVSLVTSCLKTHIAIHLSEKRFGFFVFQFILIHLFLLKLWIYQFPPFSLFVSKNNLI